MSKLEDLKRLAAARTSKEWRYAQVIDGFEARALLDSNGYLFGHIDDLQNGEWVEAINNSADELLAVVEAARAMTMEGSTDDNGVFSGWCYGMGELQDKLAALEDG